MLKILYSSKRLLERLTSSIEHMPLSTSEKGMQYVEWELAKQSRQSRRIKRKEGLGWDLVATNQDGSTTNIEAKSIVKSNGFVLLSDCNTNHKEPVDLPPNWEMRIVIMSKDKEPIGHMIWTKQEVINKIRSIQTHNSRHYASKAMAVLKYEVSRFECSN